jgi:hypothetical protein
MNTRSLLKVVVCVSLISAVSGTAKPCLPAFCAIAKPLLLQVGGQIGAELLQATINGSLLQHPEQVVTDLAEKSFIDFVKKSLEQLKAHQPKAFNEFVYACKVGAQISEETHKILLQYNLINPDSTINVIVVKLVNALAVISQNRAGDAKIDIVSRFSGCMKSCWNSTKPILHEVSGEVAAGVLQVVISGQLQTNPQQAAADIAEASLISFVQKSLVKLQENNSDVYQQLVTACKIGGVIAPEACKILMHYNLINFDGKLNEIVIRLVNQLVDMKTSRAVGAQTEFSVRSIKDVGFEPAE